MSNRSDDEPAVLELGAGRDAATTVEVGRPLELHMDSPGTTGHLWQLHADPRQVRVVEREIVANEATFGGAGRMRFVIEALRPGRADLRLELAAPWQQEPVAEHRIRLEVVAPNGRK
jgi:predicted secreted protein